MACRIGRVAELAAPAARCHARGRRAGSPRRRRDRRSGGFASPRRRRCAGSRTPSSSARPIRRKALQPSGCGCGRPSWFSRIARRFTIAPALQEEARAELKSGLARSPPLPTFSQEAPMAKKATAKTRPRAGAKAAMAERSKDGTSAPKKKAGFGKRSKAASVAHLAEINRFEGRGKAGSQVDTRQSGKDGRRRRAVRRFPASPGKRPRCSSAAARRRAR